MFINTTYTIKQFILKIKFYQLNIWTNTVHFNDYYEGLSVF